MLIQIFIIVGCSLALYTLHRVEVDRAFRRGRIVERVFALRSPITLRCLASEISQTPLAFDNELRVTRRVGEVTPDIESAIWRGLAATIVTMNHIERVGTQSARAGMYRVSDRDMLRSVFENDATETDGVAEALSKSAEAVATLRDVTLACPQCAKKVSVLYNHWRDWTYDIPGENT
jgi:hypothetical protein